MRNATCIQRLAVCLAMVGFCIPHAAWGTPVPKDQTPVVVDVALRDGGVLIGQVVDTQGGAVAAVAVSLRTKGKELVVGKTDDDGYFAFRGLRSGVYQVVAAKGHGAYRLWPQNVAPPAAQPGALIVAGSETVRGQGGMTFLRNAAANPFVVAGVVAAAVAIPVALHNSKTKGSN